MCTGRAISRASCNRLWLIPDLGMPRAALEAWNDGNLPKTDENDNVEKGQFPDHMDVIKCWFDSDFRHVL